MNAKKCDRCGKYYVTDGERVYYDGESITVFSNIGKKVSDSKAAYDLCNDCTKSFENWMKQDNGNT